MKIANCESLLVVLAPLQIEPEEQTAEQFESAICIFQFAIWHARLLEKMNDKQQLQTKT